MFHLKATIIYATLACVSVAVKINTLELLGNAVYNQSFDLVCFSTVNATVPYALFYRSLSITPVNINVATVVYDLSLNSCNVTPSSFKNYTYSCSNEGKNITLTVPGENEVEHNTFWVCTNPGGTNAQNNNPIQVFVNDPVSDVKIGNNTVVNVTEHISETFVCETSPCRPSADIYWMKNGNNITNFQGSSSIRQSGTKNITTSSLQFTALRGDNGSLLACGSYNGYGTRKLSANVIIIVHYAPDGSPSISGYLNNSVFSVMEKTSYSLICSITGGNPLASLSWNCFGIEGSSGTAAQTVTSTINLNVERSRTGQLCRCISSQEIQGSRTVFLAVGVLYSPTVNPFTSPVKVIQGKPLEVVCSADGNPSPQLTWNPEGEDKVNKSRLYYSAISRDKAVIHTCTGTNNMVPTTGSPQQGSDSKQLLIDVLYLPTVNLFTSPVKVIQGKPLEVLCSADGNPPPQLTWNPAGEDSVNRSRLYYPAISKDKAVIHKCTATSNMVPTTGSSQQGSGSRELLIDVLYSPTVNPFTSPVKVIQGKPLEVVCSADGNPAPQLTWNPASEDRMNRSRLYYAAISRDKAVIHTCTATSTMVPTAGNPQPGSDSKAILIEVLYSPIVNPFTLPVEAIEGQSLVVVCSADGSPPPQLAWTPAGEDGVNKSRLYYSAISRDKAVTHTCTATNNMVPTTGSAQMGLDSKELFINVFYNASISKFTSKENAYVLAEGSRLELQCQVDSNPHSVISLYLENDLKLKLENSLNLSYTTPAGCLDAGKYTCNATNLIMNGIAVSRELHINVTCQPRLDHRINISADHYGALGDNVTLEVYVIAYPEPANIAWYHREKETDKWQMFPYQSSSSSGLYSSIMVNLATERDFGYYWVNMSNDFGTYNNTYHIIPESKPGVPTHVSATVNGPDSVKLEWTPGFWGGHPQDFIIKYRIFPDGYWVKLDRIKDSGSTKQTVTINGLQQKTTYEFHLYAENKKGLSDNTSAIVTTTEFQGASFPIGPVAGSISGALVAGVCVILVLIFLRRRGQRSEREDDDLSTQLKEKERPKNGLVDNPVYDSSDPMSRPSTSSGATGTEYAVVVKKKAVLIENSSNVYAQVHKEKDKKKNGAAKGKHGKTSRGDIYENADLVGRIPSRENLYANSDDVKTEASGDNVYENPGAAASHGPMVNKDGLLYADLMLDPPTTKNGMPIIRGIDNRTEYAEIAYGKRAEPLPDSDEEKEKN